MSKIRVRPNVVWATGAKKTSALYRGDGPAKALLHATITGSMSLPGYRDQTQAPHETMLWDRTKKLMLPRTHLYFDNYAKALENDAGGVETNNDWTLQWELAGYLGKSTPSGGFDILEAPDIYWEQFADLVGEIVLSWGVKNQFSRSFSSTASEANPAKRMSFSEWDGWNGFCTHADVPENAHWDLPAGAHVRSIIASKIWISEDEVMATADEVAQKVWDRLIPIANSSGKTAKARDMLANIDIRSYRETFRDIEEAKKIDALTAAIGALASAIDDGLTGDEVIARIDQWLETQRLTIAPVAPTTDPAPTQ